MQVEKLSNGDFLLSYQVQDDHQTPIGPPSKFIARDLVGLLSKLVTAHSDAVTALFRVKRKLDIERQARIFAEEKLAKLTEIQKASK